VWAGCILTEPITFQREYWMGTMQELNASGDHFSVSASVVEIYCERIRCAALPLVIHAHCNRWHAAFLRRHPPVAATRPLLAHGIVTQLQLTQSQLAGSDEAAP